jgi:hypothetical protein
LHKLGKYKSTPRPHLYITRVVKFCCEIKSSIYPTLTPPFFCDMMSGTTVAHAPHVAPRDSSLASPSRLSSPSSIIGRHGRNQLAACGCLLLLPADKHNCGRVSRPNLLFPLSFNLFTGCSTFFLEWASHLFIARKFNFCRLSSTSCTCFSRKFKYPHESEEKK